MCKISKKQRNGNTFLSVYPERVGIGLMWSAGTCGSIALHRKSITRPGVTISFSFCMHYTRSITHAGLLFRNSCPTGLNSIIPEPR